MHTYSTLEHFPSAQAYHKNSVVSTIKLQSLPLIHILKNGTSVLQLESAMLLFLERSSGYDWKLRLDYLQSMVEVLCTKKLCSHHQEHVTSHLKSFLQSFGIMFSSHLMDNLRREAKNFQSTRFGR